MQREDLPGELHGRHRENLAFAKPESSIDLTVEEFRIASIKAIGPPKPEPEEGEEEDSRPDPENPISKTSINR